MATTVTGTGNKGAGPKAEQFSRENWDLDFRAELYKEEFFKTPTWMRTRNQLVPHWDDSQTRQELDDLLGIRMAERPAHLGRIISEQQGLVMVGYWLDQLKYAPTTHPWTTELVAACFHLAGSVVMHCKNQLNRVRPWVLEPRLSPPIPLPGHPAYPSGHSTQMHLMALMLAYLAPEAEPDLKRIAWEVALNRERAGLHYRSDTEAGRSLASHIFRILTTECANFQSILKKAKDTEWRERPRKSGLPPGGREDGPGVSDAVEKQKDRTRMFLDHDSLIDEIRRRVKLLSPTNSPPRFQFPGGELFVGSGALFFTREYRSTQHLIVDPNAIDPSGLTAVGDFSLSPDLTKVAYGLVAKGSDMSLWSVRELETWKDVGGEPVRVRMGTVYWDGSSTGIFYSSEPSAEEERRGLRGNRIKYHAIVQGAGNQASGDPVIFENPESPNYADYGLWEVAANHQYLAYRVQGAAEIPLASYFGERVGGSINWTPLRVSQERTLGKFITVYGKEALFRTNASGEHGTNNNFGVIAVELTQPFRTRVLVPEDNDHVLIQAQRIGDVLGLQYITPRLTNVVRFVDLRDQRESAWKPSDSGLPDYGSLSLFTGDARSNKAYFTYSSIATPPHTFVVDLTDGPTVTILESPEVPFDASRVRYELSAYESVDGERIPMQVMTRSDATEDPTFAYLYYYGAIGIPSFPEWNRKFQMILELGGMVAIANIRGGGEFGFKWQLPVKLDRRKTLDDIAAASRWLKSQYRIAGNRVVISGRSFGGLHTLAAMIHSQKDFDLLVPVMPVSDVIRFLESGLFGRHAWDDFGLTHDKAGNLLRTRKEIEMLKSWSPMQNIEKLQAPIRPIIALTADTDERVEPDHAYLMTLALQARFGDRAPVYLWVQPNGGHAASTEVDELTFIAKQFDVKALKPLV
jgi:prolyl oligopeptidase